MNEWIAFILPSATALAGTRLNRWILGQKIETDFGFGFRFALGLAIGMVVFTQMILLSALGGFNAAPSLSKVVLLWGFVEVVLLAMTFPATWKSFKIKAGHLWLLLLVPLLCSWWVFGRLSTLEGTLEFDANAFWVFKAKILYLEQGKDLINVLHQPNLGYMHMDYPMLVPGLYTLGYGAVGSVDEFVNKVWPFWMVIALCAGILSLGRVWKNPRPLPILVATFIGFLPVTLQFIRNEGGTIPMVFYTSMVALLLVTAICGQIELAPAAFLLVCAGCFSTKLEGALFAAACAAALFPFGLKRGWFKDRALWQSAIVAAICIFPYFVFRLAKPVPNAESGWLHDGMSELHSTLHCFPQMWFLGIIARFFSPTFFQWEHNGDHLHWIGQWDGLDTFVNNQLSILPWLLVALLVFSAIYHSRGRVAIGVLSVVILGLLTFLSFTTACLAEMHDDLTHGIDFSLGAVGRLYYPFFAAWFLGTVAVWFIGERNSTKAEPKSK